MAAIAYQFLLSKTHIEQAVEKGLLGSPVHRHRPPPTGWISQRAASLKGCLVLWSADGVARYLQSGLLGWQVAILRGDIRVRELEVVAEPILTDRFQTVVLPDSIREVRALDLCTLLSRQLNQTVRHSAAVYITRIDAPERELLVCKGRGDTIEIPQVGFDQEEPQKDATARYLKESLGLDSIAPVKIGVEYNYDFAGKEFSATHYYHGLAHALARPKARSSRDDDRQELSWCLVTEAKKSLPQAQQAKLNALLQSST